MTIAKGRWEQRLYLGRKLTIDGAMVDYGIEYKHQEIIVIIACPF